MNAQFPLCFWKARASFQLFRHQAAMPHVSGWFRMIRAESFTSGYVIRRYEEGCLSQQLAWTLRLCRKPSEFLTEYSLMFQLCSKWYSLCQQITRALRSEKGTKVFLMTCTDVKDQLGFLLSPNHQSSFGVFVIRVGLLGLAPVFRTCCFQHFRPLWSCPRLCEQGCRKSDIGFPVSPPPPPPSSSSSSLQPEKHGDTVVCLLADSDRASSQSSSSILWPLASLESGSMPSKRLAAESNAIFDLLWH